MKKIMTSAIVISLLFAACSSESNKTSAQTSTTKTEKEHQHDATHEHQHDATHEHQHDATNEHHDVTTTTVGLKDGSVNDLITGYLKLKNALTKDNTSDAAAAGKELVTAIGQIDVNDMTAEQKEAFDNISEDATEQAEHIGDNEGKIEHQREHFAMLSEDVNDLITLFGTNQKLYQDFCPMYDNGKGAIWISETEEIKNPYYGSKMLGCGKLKNEL